MAYSLGKRKSISTDVDSPFQDLAIMELTKAIVPQAMASYGRMQPHTAHPVLGGTQTSQYQTYGASQGLLAHQGSQTIPNSTSGVQHNVPMNSNAMHPTIFPPAHGPQSTYPVQVPEHGQPMAFHQPMAQHVNAGQSSYGRLPNRRRSVMNASNGSHPAQESAYAPQLGGSSQALFLQNPGQRFYVHSRSTFQQNSAMGFGGHHSSQHSSFNPAFGAHTYGATPRSFVQLSNPAYTHHSGAVYNSVPVQNHLVNHSGTISYNTPFAMTTQPPVTYSGYSMAIARPSGPSDSDLQTSQNFLVSNGSYNGQQTSIAHNEAYLAGSHHSGQGQLQPESTEGQQETQRNTTSIDSSTETLEQGHHHDDDNGGPAELLIEPQLESSTSDIGNATIPAETVDSSSSSEHPSSLVGALAKFQPRLDERSSPSSEILEEKLDPPTDTDRGIPEASGSSEAPKLADMLALPDELTREFSRFVDDAFPELVPAVHPPALTDAEWNVWNILGDV